MHDEIYGLVCGLMSLCHVKWSMFSVNPMLCMLNMWVYASWSYEFVQAKYDGLCMLSMMIYACYVYDIMQV